MGSKNGDSQLKKRIRSGQLTREDVARRLAELAFGEANDCVRLVLEESAALETLNLSLLSEVKRSDKAGAGSGAAGGAGGGRRVGPGILSEGTAG